MEYQSLDEFELNFPFTHSASQPETFKLFLIGETLEARTRAMDFLKKFLEKEMFEPAKIAGEIQQYKVEIVDTSLIRSSQITFHPSFEYKCNDHGNIYVPLFHNADAHPDLPQMLFDANKPGILSLTEKGYDAVINHSKKRCYGTLRFE